MRRSFVVLSIVLVGTSLLAAGCSKTKQAPSSKTGFTIGAIEPLTGVAAAYGERDKRGYELAIEDLERTFPGYQFNLRIEDGQFTPKGSVDAYNKLYSEGNMGALITFGSPQSLAAQPLAKTNNLLHMGVSTSASSFSTPDDLSFRMSPPAEFEMQRLAQLVSELHAGRVAVLYSNNEVGVSVFKAFKNLTGQLSPAPSLVAEESFPVETVDFRTSLAKIRDTKPDVVFIAGLAKHVGSVLKQSQEMGLKTQFISFRSAEDPELVRVAGSAAEGLLYTYGFDETAQISEAQKFVDSYKNKFGELPNGYNAEAYMGMRLVGEALVKCSTDTACQQQYLFGLQNHPSVFGPLSFDKNGDVFYPFFLKTIKDGKFVRYAQ
jgi:branched-chain amino acid transport system substrate-binding protein